MDIKVELTSKEYGDHVAVVYFPTHQMLIDRTTIDTEDSRALLAMAEEIQTLRAKVASADVLVAELEVALRKVKTNLKRPIKTVHGSLMISFAFVDEALATYDKLSETYTEARK